MMHRVRDIGSIILIAWAMLLLILLNSCKTQRVVEEERFTGTHYEAGVLTVEKTDMREMIKTINVNGTRHILIYDTSKAERTDYGFVSPLLADIVEEDTAVIQQRDTEDVSVEIAGRDTVYIQEQFEHKEKKIKIGYFDISLVLVILTITGIIVLRFFRR